jgi:hypothetical protein
VAGWHIIAAFVTGNAVSVFDPKFPHTATPFCDSSHARELLACDGYIQVIQEIEKKPLTSATR